MSVVLVRHAETEWSKAKRHTGRTDLPLLPEGRERAATLPQRLRGWDIEAVLCSPLIRAQETATLAGLHDHRLTLEPGLLEWDYGDVEGITTEQVHETTPGWFLWTDGAPGGEAPQDVGVRVDAVVERAAALDEDHDGDVALVAHGHVLRAFAARWCEQDVAFGARLKLDTAAVCELGVERGRRAIVRWNLT